MKLRLVPSLVLLVAIIPAVAYFWEFRDIPHFGNLQDDAVYLVSGKSVATGQGYRLLHLPGKPVQIKYPPVYPMLIAAVWRWAPDFPANLGTIAVFNLAGLAGILFACYPLYRRIGLSSAAALGLAAFLAWMPSYLYLTTSVMTEMLFTALFLWTFVVLEHSDDTDNWRWAALAGLLAATAYLTRTAASPLLLTAPLCFLIRARFRHALAFTVTAAPFVGGWQLWCYLHPFQPYDWVTRFYLGYGQMERMTVGFDNVGLVAYENIDAILTSIGEMFVFGLASTSFGHQCARLIAIAALAGTVRLMRRSSAIQYPAFACVFVTLMIFWHYPPDQRLFVPLAPLFIAGLCTELSHLWTLTKSTRNSAKLPDRAIAMVFAAMICTFAGLIAFKTVRTRLVDLPEMERQARADTMLQRRAFQEVARRTPASATILTDQDTLVNLYTGRTTYRTIVPPRLFYPMRFDRVREEFAAVPDAAHTPWDFVFVSRCDWRHTLDSSDRDSLRKSIDSRPDLEAVWRSDLDTLYARRHRAKR